MKRPFGVELNAPLGPPAQSISRGSCNQHSNPLSSSSSFAPLFALPFHHLDYIQPTLRLRYGGRVQHQGQRQ